MVFDRLIGASRRPAEPWPDLEVSLRDLDRLIAARPELAGPGRSLRGILSATFTGPLEVEKRTESSAVRSFRESPPQIDTERLRERLLAVLGTISARSPSISRLRDALKYRRIDLARWAESIVKAEFESLVESIEPIGVEFELVESSMRFALMPTLASYSGATDRSSADCPWCGMPPILGELRGLEREVRFRCGLCAGDWPGFRARCLNCEESDHRRLRSFHVEGQADRCRLVVCDSCGSRRKLVSTFARLSAPALLVADFASMHLDLVDDSRLVISSPLSAES